MRILKKLMGASCLVLAACGGGDGGGTTILVPQNTAPTLETANVDQSAQVGFAVNYDATQNGQTFTDADGNTLTYAVAITPAGSGLTAANGVISGTPTDTGTIQSPISYLFELSQTEDFATTVQAVTVTSLSYNYTIDTAGTYYWRVTAKDSATNESQASTHFTITIQ